MRQTDPLMAYPVAHTQIPLANSKLLAVSQTIQALVDVQFKQPAMKVVQVRQPLLDSALSLVQDRHLVVELQVVQAGRKVVHSLHCDP